MDAKTRKELAVYGLKLDDSIERVNAVGERAEGVEITPAPQTMRVAAAEAEMMLVPRPSPHVSESESSAEAADPPVELQNVAMPRHGAELPRDAIVVVCESNLGGEDTTFSEHTTRGSIAAAAAALDSLGRRGDGGSGSWGVPPAPTIFAVDAAVDRDRFVDQALVSTEFGLSNWGVVSLGHGEEGQLGQEDCKDPAPSPLERALRRFPSATIVVSARTLVSAFDDGGGAPEDSASLRRALNIASASGGGVAVSDAFFNVPHSVSPVKDASTELAASAAWFNFAARRTAKDLEAFVNVKFVNADAAGYGVQ